MFFGTYLIVSTVSTFADRVDELIDAEMKRLRIPGLSIAVIQDGVLVKATGYGHANLENGTLADANTVYKTASLSKPMIGVATLQLVQEGRLSLDDKISRYLDGAPPAWGEITVRHVLTSTSGIPRDPPEREYQPYRIQPLTAVIGAAYPLPLRFQPGEKWLYSNVGYYILAEIINKTSGTSWDKFIAKRIFEPAGMTSTQVTTSQIVLHRAAGYQTTKEGSWVNAEDWIAVRPSGAFLSNVLDLAKWDAFVSAGAGLSDEFRAVMWTPATLNGGGKTNYGCGWIVDSYQGRSRRHHDGQFPGFRSDYERFDDDRLSVIVLANADNANVEPLALKIAGLYAPTLATPPSSP
ncbi:MAG: serine hydrolase domain-containing protein [Nibricoccus sp.]